MISNLKIGILGGGQLGAMLIRHALDYGLSVSILEQDPDAPCAKFTSSFFCGDPLNYDDVMAFGQGLDIITIEKEAVCTDALRALQKTGVKVFPTPETIELIQDKFVQKKFLQNNNIPVVPAVPIRNRTELYDHVDKLPACLKKCRSGYDGYGVMVLHNEADLEIAFDEPCILEDLIEIEHEISVIVSRNEAGAVECYDPVLMVFDKKRFVLDFQLCPANISQELALESGALAIRIAEALDLVGLMAVEMFVTKDGRLLVNELAPRPHNSGHHTIEACTTSQYEQQLRAILGLPLGSTALRRSAVMINILEPAAAEKSNMETAIKKILGMSHVHLHWYGKKNGRVGRKIGHLTIAEDTMENAMSKAVMIRHLLKSINETN
jgi:5-(carboxyamino)imidazole ribonucleotide synthase